MLRSRPTLPALVCSALLLAACSGSEPEPASPPASEPAGVEPDAPEPPEVVEPAGFAPLAGTPLDQDALDELSGRPLLIVKVDNSPAARPQTGLEVADVVVEELVEGGITRFIALFHSQLPDAVGPVRSGRPVDVQVSSGFTTPVFAYSGARAEVQGLLRSAPVVALEEGAPGFSRVPDRRAPHDLFVAPTDILAAGLDRGAEPLLETAFVFADDPPAGPITCDQDATDGDTGGDEETSCDHPGDAVTIAMSRASIAGWTYDDDAEVYRREQNGAPTEVTGDGQVGAANVVVLATRHFLGGCCDSAGNAYPDTDVTGGDRALVLRDGERYEARWQKDGAQAPLELVTEDGEPFPLKPGPTWILLPPAAAVPS